MRPFKSFLPGISPTVIARETAWRAYKRWKKYRFAGRLKRSLSVRFRPAGYYRIDLARAGDSGQTWMSYADSICGGRFPLLGYGPTSLGFPPRWNWDFVSGKDWPTQSHEGILVVRHDGSDVKVPWELSRLQFLPALGKAWRLTGEERYRRAAMELLSNWIEQQPVGLGVNWTVAMEAALRAISICLTLELLWPFSSEASYWLENVTESLWHHLLFIESHIEFSHIFRSNHYLSNIVGLFCLSTFLEGRGIERRRKDYSRLLDHEILHQTYEDGGDYEASTGYHVLVTQMFLLAYRLMPAAGIIPSTSYAARLRAMFRWMATLADEQGCLPNVGDCDDARIEILYDDLERVLCKSAPDSLRVPSLLGLTAATLNEPNPWSSKDLMWFGMSSDVPRNRVTKAKCPSGVQVLANSGVGIVRRNGVSAFLFAMPNGIRGMGSHTHNDKLSIIIRLFGELLLSDSGTFTYTREAISRNRFRSTAAHNTILVDANEQNRIDPRPIALFSLSNDAKVSRVLGQERDGCLSLSASHSGYRRFGVLHTRTIKFETDESLVVEDVFTGDGQHTFQAHFHLARPWRICDVKSRPNEVVFEIDGRQRVEMKVSAAVALRCWSQLARTSTSYGSESSGTRICILAESRLPFSLCTRICWGPCG